MTTGKYRHTFVGIAALLCCAAAPTTLHANSRVEAAPNLRVTVMAAKVDPDRNGMYEDLTGTIDAYAVLSTLPATETHTTTTRRNVSTASWEDEPFTFRPQAAGSYLRVAVWDHDHVGEDDFVADTHISLDYVKEKGLTDITVPLSGKDKESRGTVSVKITNQL
ncbi:C2 domain-containing protein [Streptomyces lavendofoliae]|uniref:C2 domain-containing protein n=1 Tax=Streptomyces lavendofoliae TaxID=67314 RepID=A0A918I453_9ACTN|nr:C2 domain-containing protein [Streptomyces lavendofoliae]GGU67121.1 hypothetical protein GCM10010274_64530 [Streptomyces lavendofoliae]